MTPRYAEVGQRWKWTRRDGREVVLEVTRVRHPRSENETAWLRDLETGEGRWVARWRLKDAYTFVGDFGVPPGYRVVECHNPKGHYFVDPSSTPAACFLDHPVEVCDGQVVTHHLTKMWRSAGEPLPADANGLIQPRKAVGTVCAVTGEPSPEYAFDDALSANFVTPRFHQIAFPYAAESRITLSGGREVPALSRAACWAIRSLAFRSATWIFDGERIEFAPMAPFATGERQKIEPEKMRAAFGGRSSTDYLDWLLRPRPVGTVAAVPLYGIDHGGEQNFHRLPWPSGCKVDPLVKLQSKHTVMHVRPTTDAGQLRLQIDDGLCIALDVESWAEVAASARELLTEVLALLPEKARLLGVARGIIERGPTAAREPAIVLAVGDFHRRHIQRVKSPFWPLLVRALYQRVAQP